MESPPVEGRGRLGKKKSSFNLHQKNQRGGPDIRFEHTGKDKFTNTDRGEKGKRALKKRKKGSRYVWVWSWRCLFENHAYLERHQKKKKKKQQAG